MQTVNNQDSNAHQTNTAHLDWDVRWQTEEGRSDWVEPEPFVIETIPLLKASSIGSVIDLGCGIGRHSILFAQNDFKVDAVDASPAAIDFLAAKAQESNLNIRLHKSQMIDLPFENESVEYVLAWNVIYHGNLSVVTRSISEILRVLKPGGLFQGTMLSKRNKEIETGTQIANNTYINSDRHEKRHPHFYCNGAELLALFNGLEPLKLYDAEHKRPGSYHWQFLVEKK